MRLKKANTLINLQKMQKQGERKAQLASLLAIPSLNQLSMSTYYMLSMVLSAWDKKQGKTERKVG